MRFAVAVALLLVGACAHQKTEPPRTAETRPESRPAFVLGEVPPTEHALPGVRVRTLKTGLELVSLDRPTLPLFLAELRVNGGHRHLGGGLAPILAELISARPSELEELGGRLEVETTADFWLLTCEVPSRHAAACLRRLSEVVQAPSFDGGELEILKNEALARLARLDAVVRRSRERAHAILFAGDGYATMAPDPRRIIDATPEALEGHFRAAFVPPGSSLVLVGDLGGGELEDAAALRFSSWTAAGETERAALDAATPADHIFLIHETDTAFAHILVASRAAPRAHADWAALKMGAGLVDAELSSWAAGSSFVLRYAASAENAADALEKRLDALAGLRRGDVDGADLERVRRRMSGRFAVELQGLGAVARALTLTRAHGLGDGYPGAWRKTLAAVDAAAVKAAAERWLEPGAIVVVGDQAQIAAPLSRIAEVRVLGSDGTELRRIPKAAPPAVQ